MKRETLKPREWDIIDTYIEDMLVALKNEEIDISTCKAYLSQYIYKSNQSDIHELIGEIDEIGQNARQNGWNKAH